jgi:2,3-bisphosphoglycerate-dependent phosphoglycerate mutase
MSPSALSSQDPVSATKASSAGASSARSGGTVPALWLVRHGESTWNTAGLAQGHNDQAVLTSRGLHQATEAAEQFRGRSVRAIYASDLRRARQTAAAFGQVLGLPVAADARLRERSLGVLEGTPSAEIGPAVTGLDAGRVTDPDARPYGGESVRDLYARAAAFCAALADMVTSGREKHEKHGASPGPTDAAGDVVIVAHGGTVRVIEAYLSGVPVEEMGWGPVENARVVRIPHLGAQPVRT